MKSYKIAEKLFLNVLALPTGEPVAAPPAGLNHIFWFDVSGSMYSNLASIRVQVKNRLTQMLGEHDTVTLGWFSGRNECGILVEGIKVSDVQQLQKLHTAVDRYLQTVGLTGFKDPLQQTLDLAKRLTAANGNPISMFFLSDGQDNQWPKSDVLTAAEKLSPVIAAATVVEYGYYADRPMLTAIAERLGGVHIFASSFEDYEVAVKSATGFKAEGKKIALTVPPAIADMVFGLRDGQIPTFARSADGSVLVDASLGEIAFLSEQPTSLTTLTVDGDEAVKTKLYAAIALAAQRMLPAVVKPLLRVTGDVRFIEQFANCFGKQQYSAFVASVTEAAYLPVKRLTEGYDPTRVPPDDAFTVLDLVQLLSADEGNRVLLKSPEFQYNKISRGRVDANTVLTSAEEDLVADLADQISKTRDLKQIAALSKQIEAITNKPGPIKFVENEGDGEDGYSVSSLTYNEDRPNISILITRNGYLDLSGQEGRPASVPDRFPMTTFRNYSIITDGLVNVNVLPLKLSAETQKALRALHEAGRLPAGVFTAKGKIVDGQFETEMVSANLLKLPVINTKMVTSVRAEDLIREEIGLMRLKARQKVINSLITEATGTRTSSEGLKDKYGEDGAAWLKDRGITDRGFSPKSVQAESTDFYMSKELEVKLAGFSSLPSLKDARAGKGGAAGAMMNDELRPIATLDLPTLKTEQDVIRKAVRAKIAELARTKFSIIVGQTWFLDCSGLDDNVRTVAGIKGTIVLGESQIKI
jgi:hypothetical protein